MSSMIEFVSAADFFKTVGNDERVYFLVRHGERDHIKPNDPDHGAFVGLTDRGREQALKLGKSIAASCTSGVSADCMFFSSPVGRCMQTAEYIGLGLGIDAPDVMPQQPLAEFFVKNYDAYMETHVTGFYQGICRWLDGTAADSRYVDPAYFPLAARSQEMVQFMLSHGKAPINIFCSHDAWIVPCLNHFCGLRFSPSRWMNFLTGLAVVIGKDQGSGDVGAVRRFVPVTGLDTGWMLF